MAIKSNLSIYIMAIGIVCAVASWTSPAAAKPHHRTAHHHTRHHSRALVDRTASYADIVIDADTGQILHATNPDSLRHPASLTKMMTLYVTFQAIESGKLSLNNTLPISANASEQSPSKLGLRRGQRIRVEDAILGLVTESANDAAVVLAEWMGGSESGFGQLMTRQARALGMSRTRFDNPSGLPDEQQVTTARDMAILGSALIHHYPQYYTYFSHDSFYYAGINHHNHNHLMERYDGMDGIKTGYIRASGFNLVASAKRGNTRLIGVVFGGHSATARDNQMAQLLDDTFQRLKSGRGGAANTESTDDAEGDATDTRSSEGVRYVTLPAKIAAVFAPNRSTPLERGDDATVAPVQTASVANATNWGIQIGAYSDAKIGQQALENVMASLPAIMSKAQQQLTPVATANGGAVYRARLINLDPHSAQMACAWLIKRGQSCLTIAAQ